MELGGVILSAVRQVQYVKHQKFSLMCGIQIQAILSKYHHAKGRFYSREKV
jgi:hypothetical protein